MQISLGGLKIWFRVFPFLLNAFKNQTNILPPKKKCHFTVGHQVFKWSQNPVEEKINTSEDLKAFQCMESL